MQVKSYNLDFSFQNHYIHTDVYILAGSRHVDLEIQINISQFFSCHTLHLPMCVSGLQSNKYHGESGEWWSGLSCNSTEQEQKRGAPSSFITSPNVTNISIQKRASNDKIIFLQILCIFSHCGTLCHISVPLFTARLTFIDICKLKLAHMTHGIQGKMKWQHE